MKTITLSAFARSILASGCTCLLLGGCVHKRPPMHPASKPAMTLREENAHRLADLRQSVASFREQANALPGADDAEHRQIMEQAFDDLSVSLPILVGEEPSSAFRLQMRSVVNARIELADNPTLSPEPIEDSGLRSAVAAMGRIAHEEFYGASERSTDRIRVALRTLDRTTGPMHRLAVRDVVRQMADELEKLAETYQQHIDVPEKKHHHHK
ncbi:MAG TPA: hypothetical protein VGG19_11670 [Tepidisphaeraceae bacterium]|jgi:hypothetical protein